MLVLSKFDEEDNHRTCVCKPGSPAGYRWRPWPTGTVISFDPPTARCFERLASFSRLVMFDRRGTRKDLVVGSGLRFSDRGQHALRGVPDRWRLYAVDA